MGYYILYSTRNELESDIEDIEESKNEVKKVLKELKTGNGEKKSEIDSLKNDYPEHFTEGAEEESIEKILDYLNKEQDNLKEKLDNFIRDEEEMENEFNGSESSGSITPTQDNPFPERKPRGGGDFSPGSGSSNPEPPSSDSPFSGSSFKASENNLIEDILDILEDIFN
jgi:hypothetical protein